MTDRILHRIADNDGKPVGWMFWCPACENCHAYYVEQPNGSNKAQWQFNGNIEKPTFTPSLLAYRTLSNGQRETICHLFVTDGLIQYQGDCPHKLAGQTIPMEPF